MDWRLGAAGFIVTVGLVAGWLQFGTLIGAVLSAVFLVGLVGVSVAIDEREFNMDALRWL